MNAKAEELASKVLALSKDERTELIDRVLNSLGSFSSAEVEKAWLDLAQRRWAEIEAGRTEVVPAEVAMKRARSAIR